MSVFLVVKETFYSVTSQVLDQKQRLQLEDLRFDNVLLCHSYCTLQGMKQYECGVMHIKWISFQIRSRFQVLMALLQQMTGTKMEEDSNSSGQ
jgi:hypothetical protein